MPRNIPKTKEKCVRNVST